MSASEDSFALDALTSNELERRLGFGPTVALLPIGSVEPHGPHLPLRTDAILGEEASRRAARVLSSRGLPTLIAPTVAYGVTDYARGFRGAVGIPADVLTALVRAIVTRLLAEGFSHVCLVNNHLEPAHDAAVREALVGFEAGLVSVASPLTRRWARTLSEEFKRGDCHAGRYETSLVLAARHSVREGYEELPPVPISLADGIRRGLTTFQAMGIDRAYTGTPSEATAEEGELLYEKLVAMIVTEVDEALALAARA